MKRRSLLVALLGLPAAPAMALAPPVPIPAADPKPANGSVLGLAVQTGPEWVQLHWSPVPGASVYQVDIASPDGEFRWFVHHSSETRCVLRRAGLVDAAKMGLSTVRVRHLDKCGMPGDWHTVDMSLYLAA